MTGEPPIGTVYRPESSAEGLIQPSSATAAVRRTNGIIRNLRPRGVMGWGSPPFTKKSIAVQVGIGGLVAIVGLRRTHDHDVVRSCGDDVELVADRGRRAVQRAGRITDAAAEVLHTVYFAEGRRGDLAVDHGQI